MMAFDSEATLATWHAFVATGDPSLIEDLLAEDIAFHSPVFWKPKHGKPMALAILTAATHVFEDFTYHQEWADGTEWALVFSARLGETQLKGVDLITFNEAGQIITFEVCVRPLNALPRLAAAMGQQLTAMGALPA